MTEYAPASFEIELRRTGTVRRVPADRSALDVVREEVPHAEFNCLQGECGACVATVLDGVPDHRDTVLSERAREAGKRIILCVSRSLTPRIAIDL
ncbi:2Fe-2S iron-sulfur cluster-binding protein [Williamsia soli]|uniref:2Fe-2S iron-sulfur cluster-binding protein n=1 Tax=Williamsia soli TaxID=364929 RepID=UPI001A9DF20C|nr:2Fe-2S iron-sulfur cluster binding domain-containing protein [Williamsia soli]